MINQVNELELLDALKDVRMALSKEKTKCEFYQKFTTDLMSYMKPELLSKEEQDLFYKMLSVKMEQIITGIY